MFVISILSSCAPVSTPAQTQNMVPAVTLTTAPIKPTNTPVFYPTPHRPPYPAIPSLKPVLFSYTILPDGGDEINVCLDGDKQPTFILYSDGELILFRDGQYWHSILSRDEIDLFVEKISDTGLPKSLEAKFDWSQFASWAQISFQGKEFYPLIDGYSESVFKKTVDIIRQYHPKSLQPYIPENITLWVFKVDKIESYVADLPTPIPPTKIWKKEIMPLSEYYGYYIVTGITASKIMAQFDNFPGYQIFSDDNSLYLVGICANISNEFYP